MRDQVPLGELCITMMVGAVSDKFGLPAVVGDAYTPSGFPLSDNPDTKGAEEWLFQIAQKFEWLVSSKETVAVEDARETLKLIGAAIINNDKHAEAQLVGIANRTL